MNTALGRKTMNYICHNCDYQWEIEDFVDWDEYEEWDEVVHDEMGCPMCRMDKGFTPYITYRKEK